MRGEPSLSPEVSAILAEMRELVEQWRNESNRREKRAIFAGESYHAGSAVAHAKCADDLDAKLAALSSPITPTPQQAAQETRRSE